MATTQQPRFEVVLECKNCGDEWIEQYGAETVVSDDSDGVRAIPQKGEFGDHFREQCPTCDLYKFVNVETRQPIDEGDEQC